MGGQVDRWTDRWIGGHADRISLNQASEKEVEESKTVHSIRHMTEWFVWNRVRGERKEL